MVPDYSWLEVPVFDPRGRLRHSGGIVDWPGLYVTGLPVLRRRRSTYIDGAAADAAALIDHLARHLGAPASEQHLVQLAGGDVEDER